MRHAFCVLFLLFGMRLSSEPVAVRYVEGTAHAFLALKSQTGALLATGDLIEFARNGHIISRLVFHFRDGSLYNEVTAFSQHNTFRLISSHLIEKGRSFPDPVDILVEASGHITQRTIASDGKEKTTQENLDLPPDISNGMLLPLLMNISPNASAPELSVVAPAAKPRLVRLAIERHGEAGFSTGGIARQATEFLIKVKLGGLAGVVAPLIGKQPADMHFWILTGVAPAFVKWEGQLYEGGPIWCIEQMSPRLTS